MKREKMSLKENAGQSVDVKTLFGCYTEMLAWIASSNGWVPGRLCI